MGQVIAGLVIRPAGLAVIRRGAAVGLRGERVCVALIGNRPILTCGHGAGRVRVGRLTGSTKRFCKLVMQKSDGLATG